MTPFRASGDGTNIAVRVQPRASRNEIAGLHGAQLRIRLTAPPVDGAANAALLDLLAERLGVGRVELGLVSGASSRSKVVSVRSLTPARVSQLLGLGG